MSGESPERVAVACRMAVPADADALVDLFVEMQAHHWGASEAPPADATERYVRLQVLPADSPCEIAVAESGGTVVAFAAFGIIHPGADSGGTLYLKDIYTTVAARSAGVGEWLMRFLARQALARGCTRLDWTTQDVNVRARSFYERLGATQVRDKVYYRLHGDTLRSLGESSPLG